MILNSLIGETLAPLNVPVSFQNYSGNASTYITYFEFNQGGARYADDDEEQTMYSIQVDIWSKANYKSIEVQVEELMRKAGFYRIGAGEFYEEDTKFHHKYFRFNYYMENGE